MAVLMRKMERKAHRAACRQRSVLVCVLVLCVWPVRAGSQTLGASESPGGADLPVWLTRWSPLSNIGDLPRELPGGAVALPSLLTVPAPRVGLFWTAGNPGALPFEISDSYARIGGGYKRDAGDYRRPLDAGRESRSGGSALGWQTLEARGAAIGNVVVERLHRDRNAHADVVLPFPSNPFTVLDTLGDAMATTVMRLEGAGGWRLGPLGIGLGTGFDGREMSTVTSAVPRRVSVSASGVTGGLVYELAAGGMRVGVFGRRVQTSQTVLKYASAGESRMYEISGYFNPLPLELRAGSTSSYWRRYERTGWAYGASIGGRLSGAEWVGFAQLENSAEIQYKDSYDNDPPTDDWDSDGWTIGFAALGRVSGGRVLVTVSGRYTKLAGDAVRMDLGEVNFSVTERVTHVSGEVRLEPWPGWSGAVNGTLGRQHRWRHDFLARVSSDLYHWAPAFSVEIARMLPHGFAVSVGGGISRHSPWGGIPNPSQLSEAYQEWIAPELALYSTEAAGRAGALAFLWRPRDGLSLWASGKLASLSPSSGLVDFQYAPEGSRTRTRIEVGVTIGSGGEHQ